MDEMLDEYYNIKVIGRLERSFYGNISNRVESIFSKRNTGEVKFSSITHTFCENGLISCSEKIYEKV